MGFGPKIVLCTYEDPHEFLPIAIHLSMPPYKLKRRPRAEKKDKSAGGWVILILLQITRGRLV